MVSATEIAAYVYSPEQWRIRGEVLVVLMEDQEIDLCIASSRRKSSGKGGQLGIGVRVLDDQPFGGGGGIEILIR